MTASGTQSSPSRNAPCPCGSGKKYKRCCGQAAAGRPVAAVAPDKLQQVVRHYQQGNLPAAGQLAEQLLKSNPKDAGLIEITAAVALQTGNAELAAERFAQQTRLQPDNALAHSNLCMALHTLDRDEEAFLSGQQATQLDPQLADAWNNLGNIYKSGNHLEGAIEHYEKALALQPDDPEILVNSGSVKQLLGDTDTAEQYYRRAIQIYPQFASAHNNLGAVLKHQERYDEAEQAFRTALQLQPGNPEFLTNLGTLMSDQARIDEARDHLQQAMQVDPDCVGAWVSMGNLLEKLNDQDNAQRHFEKALLLDPENSTVLCNMGKRLFDLGEQQESVDHFVRALKHNPNSAKGLAGLGRAMLREDKIDKAAGYIEKSLELAPWDPHAHMAMAGLHEARNEIGESESEWQYVTEHWPRMPDGHIGLASHYAGQEDYDSASLAYRHAEQNDAISAHLYNSWSQMEEHINNLDDAEHYARKAVELDPDFAGLKILQATLARRRKDFGTALEILQQIDVDAIAMKQTRATYLFELGNVQDKLGNYREAFAAYKEANNIKNHFVGRVYNEDADNDKFKTLKRVFSKDNWQHFAQLANAEETVHPQPVFIVGFPRSGTSLLEQILGSHREIAPAGELIYILRSADTEAARITGSKLPFPAVMLDDEHPLDRETVHALRDYYLTSAAHKAVGVDDNTRWITDKMPHNAKYVGLIRMLFPKSPIIHISRHPLNPCLSAYFSNFASTHRYTSSLVATAMHYRNMMDMLDHYRDIGIDFMEIHYEDLVMDQENVTRKLLDYIGAPWDPNCLQHHKSDRVVRTASYEQVTQKIYTSSLNRYQNYWEGVQDMIPILQSTMERFGYTVEPPPSEQ